MASARCPQCGRFFCKECITEHAGQVLCTTCLQKTVLAPEDRRASWALVLYALQIGVGLCLAWTFFYCLAQLLLLIPTSFHEGSLWQSGWWQG